MGPKEPTREEAAEEGFLQAGGRVPFGVTDFKVNTEGTYPNENPSAAPDDPCRVDVASGPRDGNPFAVATCSCEEFGSRTRLAIHTGSSSSEPKCPRKRDRDAGRSDPLLRAELSEGGASDLPVEGNVYDLVQPRHMAKVASRHSTARRSNCPNSLTEAKLEARSSEEEHPADSRKKSKKQQYYAHGLVKGNVEWGTEAKGTERR